MLSARGSAAWLVSVSAVAMAWPGSTHTRYRGDGRITAYQVMGILAIAFATAITVLMPTERGVAPYLPSGIEAIWHPEVLLLLQALWAVVFIRFGKSMVTSAQISFHLREDR